MGVQSYPAGEISKVRQPGPARPQHVELTEATPSGQGWERSHALLHLQRQIGNRGVQRLLARAGEDAGQGLVAPETATAIEAARGAGQALDREVRNRVERDFGADFREVRVHTDRQADHLSQALAARAFTVGQDIFFRQGEHNPASARGQELLAHELTHVVQQTGAQAGRALTVSRPDDPAEQEAERVAARLRTKPQAGDDDRSPYREIEAPAPAVNRSMLLRSPPAVMREEEEEKEPPPKISTPLPEDVTRSESGAAALQVGEIPVTVLPDGQTEDKALTGKAETKFHLQWETPKYKYKGSKVTSVDPAPAPKADIQTTYGPGAKPEDTSGYGKGTTPEDVAAGKTSLEYHEGSHGADILKRLKEKPPPKFTGKPGMTLKQYEKAEAAYKTTMDKYEKDMQEYTEKLTDCVGKKASFCKEPKKP